MAAARPGAAGQNLEEAVAVTGHAAAAIVPCRCCGEDASLFADGQVLGHHTGYFQCAVCEYVQTGDPHWLDDAYRDPINIEDTGILARNRDNVGRVIATLWALGNPRGLVLDEAGGYGVLVRMLRDAGIDARWRDKYCDNLFARGFEYRGEDVELATAFEVFEHLSAPQTELASLMDAAPNLLVSTDLIPSPPPAPADWWYYGPEHGQHIGFYTLRTLHHLARRFDRYLLSDGHSFHLFSSRPVSAARWKFLVAIRKLLAPATQFHLGTRTWRDHLAVKGHGRD